MSDGQVRSMFADWNDVNYRVDYVLSRMGRCYGVSARMTSRAYYLASRLLGLDYESTRHMTILWRAGAGADPLVAILGGMVPRDEGIGFVYHAICPRFAGVVKVGFTTQPEERAQSLSSRYGSPVTITRQWPGTMLDEHVEHCRLDVFRMHGEWFEAGPHLFASVPATPPVASASPDHAAEKSVGTDTPLEPSPAAPPPPPAVGAKTVPAPIRAGSHGASDQCVEGPDKPKALYAQGTAAAVASAAAPIQRAARDDDLGIPPGLRRERNANDDAAVAAIMGRLA